jgi:predicted nucleotidyltransferase
MMCDLIKEYQKDIELTKKYMEALDNFLDRIKQDRYVLAVILAGSLEHDLVWEKSDIDLILIVDDMKKPRNFYSLVENGIIINAFIYNRSQFKRDFDSELSSSQFHSWISKTKLIYTRDDTLKELYDNLSGVGEGDRDLQLLKYAAFSIAGLAKAQKFLYIKKDPLYSAYFILSDMLQNLARIEVLLNGGIPLRDVIYQALVMNPEFFQRIYTDLLQEKKEEAKVKEVLEMIEAYLSERQEALFKLLINILKYEGDVVGISALQKKLEIANIDPAILVEACEWLAEKNRIQKLSTPVRLTTKSWLQVNEAAYYYMEGNQND